MSESELSRVRLAAEAAVADMDDGDLKVKAFEVILRHLLATATPGEHAESCMVDGQKQKSRLVRQPERSVVARVLALKEMGFFQEQRTIGDIQAELARHGWHYAQNNLSGKLQSLTRRRFLRRVLGKDGNRTVWKYSVP